MQRTHHRVRSTQRLHRAAHPDTAWAAERRPGRRLSVAGSAFRGRVRACRPMRAVPMTAPPHDGHTWLTTAEVARDVWRCTSGSSTTPPAAESRNYAAAPTVALGPGSSRGVAIGLSRSHMIGTAPRWQSFTPCRLPAGTDQPLLPHSLESEGSHDGTAHHSRRRPHRRRSGNRPSPCPMAPCLTKAVQRATAATSPATLPFAAGPDVGR